MTNEMKNVPALRFPEFDGDWEEKKLKDISNKGMYGIGASATEFDGENVYVRITDINESSRKINNDKLTSPDRLDKKYLLNENDVLFARTGASTGKTYIHKHYDRDKNYYFAGFLIKFEFKNNYLANFIFQNTLTKRFENWVSVMSVRSGQPGINSEEYGKLKMRFPSKVEQNKIGDFFSKLDRQIELEEQKLEKLEEQKKGYMQKIFSQELRFKDENGEKFSDWQTITLGQLSDIKTGSLDANAMVPNGKYKFFTCARETYQIDKYAFDTEALLISGNGANVGYIHYYKGKFNAYQRTYVLDNIQNDINFIKYYLERYLIKRIYSEKRDGNTPYITRSTLYDMSISIPLAKLEQNKIGNFFTKFDELIEKQNQKIDELKKRKQGFLQKMFV